MDEQLIIFDALHYNENNNHRLPCKINSVDYENNHFKLRKEYINSLEQNSALMKLSSKCFGSVVTL